MSFNPNNTVDCSVTTFSSWCTELAPSDLHIGLSPDCQEVGYAPGSVFTRDSFRKVYSSPFPDGVTIVYGKSFKAPDGTIKNFYFDSKGILWMVGDDGVPQNVLQSTPGSFCKSITAFGREYFSVSDGLHGSDVPFQYDGTYFDRVTQDGPSSAPQVENIVIPASNLRSSGSATGDFVIIPLSVGSIAIGCGIGDSASSIPLPEGYINTRMVSSAAVGGGWDRDTQAGGVYQASSAGGVLNASFANRSGASAISASVNWVAAAWTVNAEVNVSTVGNVTFVTFTTSTGYAMGVAVGTLTDSAPSFTLPSGFTTGNTGFIASAAGLDVTGNGMQGVLNCTLSGSGSTFTRVLNYHDVSGNLWSGNQNFFCFMWQDGVTVQGITNGTAAILDIGGGQQIAIMYGQLNNHASFGLPSGFTTVTAASASMTGDIISGESYIAHGWPECHVVSQGMYAYYLDGQGNSWDGRGNFFAVSINGTAAQTSLFRRDNTVTAYTLNPHNLKVGYMVQISGVGASVVGGSILSIKIDNESEPGIATVTTSQTHGLVPGNDVSISDVDPVIIGTSITAATRAGQVVTLDFANPHNVLPGAVITVDGVSDSSFDGTFSVEYVISNTRIVYLQADSADATSSGGTASIVWPIPDTLTPTYYEVVASPTETSFQIQVSYTDGTWNSGTATFSWNGKFYVTKVDDDQTFEYQQYGPDLSTTNTGIVTPYGQIAPGKHQIRITYLTRQDAVLKSSPWVNFIANGGQYLQVSNICIGPPNIKARIIELTGVDGSYFYYLPVPAVVNGIQVSTSTQIDDNTTTSVLIDVSDNTLYTGICTSIPGNNTPAQIVIDGSLGFNQNGSRLITYGQRNRLQSILNPTFDGGYLPSTPDVPSGWEKVTYGGSIVAGRFNGFAWSMDSSTGGKIRQYVYRDQNGAPIATGDTLYRIRCYIQNAGTVLFSISSASTGFASLLSFSANGWNEGVFSSATPTEIPEDLEFSMEATVGTPIVDEISMIYDQTPYLDSIEYASYVNNPEGFDGITGKFGPAQDPQKIMGNGIINGIYYILTRDPSGRLHEVIDNGVTEPSGWTVTQVAAECGALSAFCITSSQADDTSASGGEKWFAWASEAGARIFGGDQPYRIGQEVQPSWHEPSSDMPQINMEAALTISALNDPIERRLYFFLPIGDATGPNRQYVIDYKELDGAYQIASASPMGGQDICRKWTRWMRPMFGAARMYLNSYELSIVFFGGNGLIPGQGTGYGNVYVLDRTYDTDDDFGVIQSYYVTASVPSREEEGALGYGRKILAYLAADISGKGKTIITPYVNTLDNPWRLVCVRNLSLDPLFDLEWTGGIAQGNRFYMKIESVPLDGETDNWFAIQKLMLSLRQARMAVRGSAH